MNRRHFLLSLGAGLADLWLPSTRTVIDLNPKGGPVYELDIRIRSLPI